MIALNDLRAICQHQRTQVLANFEEPLNAAVAEFGIDTPMREAAFIAQVCEETVEFQYLKEIGSGREYEGRKDLGNMAMGDGTKFKGRGLLQITGVYNYRDCGTALGLDLLTHPELLEIPVNACRSGGWFWQKHALNAFADSGDFVGLTRHINGGINGLESRQAYYARAKAALIKEPA